MTVVVSTPAQRALRRHLIVSTALVSALRVAAVSALGCTSPALAQVLPGPGSVAGQSISGEIGAKIAGISNPVPTTLQVDLKANATIINWNGFNVPVLNTANFSDTRGGIATGAITVLNRDIGSIAPVVLSPSVIAGNLKSDQNVSVFVINTAGVLFSSTAAVNVGGLVASGIDIADAKFLNPVGGYAFKTSGGTGTVTVQSGASLTASSTLPPGSIVLIGAAIDSRGTLSATGDVGIVAATDVNVVMAPGSPLSVTINEGTPLAAPIVAQGTIGGRNVLFAAATYDTVLNALLDVEAAVTATTATSGDVGVALIAGHAEATPLVALAAASNNAGVINTTLGGSLNATGPGGGVTLLTSAGIAKSAVAATATLSAAAGVNVHAATGDIVLASADAGAGTAVIRADAGDIQLDNASGNGITLTGNNIGAAAGGRTALTSTGGLGLTVTNNARLGDVTAVTGATLAAASVDATSLAVSAGALAASVTTGDLNVGTVSGATGATLRALTGAITATQADGGTGTIDGKAQSLDIASVTGGSLALTSTLTTLKLGGGTAGPTLLSANTDLIVSGTLTVTGDATLTANGLFSGGGVAASGALGLTTLGVITATSLAGGTGLSVNGPSMSIGSAAAANGNVTLVTTGGTLAATSVTAGNTVTLQAGGSAQVGSASGAGIGLTATDLTGTGTGRAALTSTAGVDVTVTNAAKLGVVSAVDHATVSAGSIDATSIIVSAGALSATATSGDIGLGTGSGSTGTTLRALSGQIVAAQLGGGSGIVDGRAESLNIGNVTDGKLTLVSTLTTLTLGGGTAGTTKLVAATDLAVMGTLAVTGGATLGASGNFNGGSVTATGSLKLNATGAVVATSLVGSTGLTVSGSRLALGNAATTSNDLLLTTTTGALTLGTATSGGKLALNAATTAAVTGAVTAGGDYGIAATAVTLGDGTPVLQSAAGAVDITASSGGITGLANLTLRSDGGGTGGHLLVLDAGGGIGFDATSLLQGGPAQQSAVGIRQGAATPLVLGGVGALGLGTIDAGHAAIGQLTNSGAITFGGPVSVVQSLAVTSIMGTITTGAVAVTGAAQSLSLTSGIASDIVATGSLSATGSVVLAADRNVTVGDVQSFGSNVSATAVDALTEGTITAAGSIVATAGNATVGGLVSGTDAVALDRSASVTAASLDVGAVNIGTDLILKATAGVLTLGGGSAGNSVTLTDLGTGPLTISGNLDVGTAAGSSGAALLTTSTDARIFALRSLTGDILLTVPGALTGLSDGIGGFAGARLSAPAAGHDITVNAGDSVILAALVAGRDVAIDATGTAALTGTVAAGRNYSVTGATVMLGASGIVDQRAGGAVTIVSSTGGIVGHGQLTLTSDTGGLGGRDLILRSAAGIAFGGSLLFGGPARTSSIRLGAAPGAPIALGQVDALRLVSYDAALSATALDSSGELSAGQITTSADLIVGSTLAGRPANLTLGAATSLNGAVTLAAVGFIAGPAIGEAQFASPVDLTAATSVTTRGSSAELGFVTAGSFVDLRTAGDLDLDTSNAGTTTTLAASGNLRLFSATGAGDINVTAGGDFSGFAAGPASFSRAMLTSTGGAVAVTGNGVPATTGLVLLGAVQAATAISAVGRQLDVSSAVVSAGPIVMQARELSPANLVSLTLGTATASGDITLSSAAGSGAARLSGTGGLTAGSVTSTAGNVAITAATALAATSLQAASAVTISAGTVAVPTIIANSVMSTSTGDSQFTDVTGTGAVGLTAGGAMNFQTVTSIDGAVELTAGAMTGNSVNAATAITVTGGSAQLGTVAAGTALTTHTSGDLVLTTATAGTTTGLTSGSNLRLGTAIGAGSLTLIAGGDITGLNGESGFGSAILTSTGGTVAATANGIPATTGLILLGAVNAATGISVVGRQLDIASATAPSGEMLLQARELSPANFVGLTLGTANASGDIALSSAIGTGVLAAAGNGAVVAGNVTSTSGSIGIMGDSVITATLIAGTTVTATSTGDSQFTDVTGTGAVALAAGGAMSFDAVASTGDAVVLTAGAMTGGSVAAATALTVTGGSAALGTVAAGTALISHTSDDLVLTTATAGTTIGLTSGGNLRLGTTVGGANLTLTSGGDISGLNGDSGFSRAVLTSTGGAVAVTANGVPETTGLILLGAVNAANGISIVGRQLDISSVAVSAGPIVMQARELSPATLVSLTLGTATATGDITLTSAAGSSATSAAGNGGLTAGAVTSSAGMIGLTAAGSVTSGPLSAALAVHGRGASFALTTIGAGTTLDLASSAGGIGFTSATSGGDATLVAAGGGVTGTSLNSFGGAATLTATGTVDLGSLTAVHAVTVAAGPLARLSTVTAGGALTVSAAQVALGTATAGSLSLSAGSGGAAIGTVTTSGETALNSAADITVTAATSTAGGFAATAAGTLAANSIAAAKTVAATGASLEIDAVSAGGATTLTATSGSVRLGTATTGGDATITAATGVALTGALTVGGNLTATGTTVDLAATGSATQAAAGGIAITATGGAITGGAGLTLVSGSSGSGKALALKATAANGTIVFAPASIIAGGTATAGADVAITATGLVQLGAVTAAGHAITLSASGATLAADLRAAKISLVDSGAAALRLGDTPAGNSAEFAAVPTGHFDLSGAAIAHLSAATLLIDAHRQNVVIGDLAIGAATGSTGLAVQTLGRIDLLGRLVASGTVVGRTLVFGGDGSTTALASVIRLAATPGGGGRLIADGAAVTLRGDRIGAGYDANLLTPLALTPAGGTPLTTADVATRFISQPNGALYAANFNGQPFYTDPVLVRAATLAVDFGRYALFQNTGLAGFSAGIVVGTPGSTALPAALQLTANDAAVPNGVAIFGTVNGIGGVATALLGPNGVAVGGGVSRANARANGCVIGATGGGCLASSLAQPGLLVFESRAEILRTSDSLTLPFDPLVGTSNEALFSDIVGSDTAAEIAGCAAGDRRCEDGRKPK